MAATLLLNTATWGLTLDANGNIAVATDGYALAQDAASAIKTFLGEVYFDTTLGVPYLTQILGRNPSLALLKQQLVNAALSASSEIATAQVFITELTDRQVIGQVQLVSVSGQVSAANFATVSPYGVG